MNLREYQDSLSDQEKEFRGLTHLRYSFYNTMSMEKYHEEELGE